MTRRLADRNQRVNVYSRERVTRAITTSLATACVAVALALSLSAAGRDGAAEAADHVTGSGLITDGHDVQRVTIILNKSRTFNLASAFATATVGNGDIADAMPLSDRVLYVQGKRIGTTNITIFDRTAKVISVIDVEVTPDVAVLRQKIQSSKATRDIRISASGGRVILSGAVPDAVTADRAMSVAQSLVPEGGTLVNAMQIAASQQVLLKVRFLEAGRNAGRDVGVNLFASNNSKTHGATTGFGNPPVFNRGETPSGIPIFGAIGTLLANGGTAQPFGTFVARLLSTNSGNVDAVITALETRGLVRRLAEPDLVALSGDTAAFLAGGEFPVPSIQPGGGGGFPVTTIEYKPFGVQLTFSPTVLADGKINLRLAPSVSEIANTVQTAAGPVPTFSKREARTTIELRDGQSFAIAGLLQALNRRDVGQLPWIGTVPVLGALFRSASFQQEETDLVVIVTPHLVAPAAPGQQIASPLDSRVPSNDVDFFLGGQTEQRKRYQEFVTRGTGLHGPYGHMIRPAVGEPTVSTRD
jgi:pilus assembly protein CpaC